MQPRGLRKVLLFSTGLDSFILLKLFSHDAVVFVKTGTKDNELELLRLQTYGSRLPGPKVTIVDCSFLRQFELENKIIPFRNHIFCCVAAQYGHRIYLASTAGDTTRDKDYTFAETMSAALHYFATGPAGKVRWPGERSIILPLRRYTKRQAVQLYLESGYDPAELVTVSSSCYYPTLDGSECGQCRSCLRKFVALYANGIRPAFATPSVAALTLHLQESLSKGRKAEANDVQEVICKLEA
jgi:7-cyano-7-deazaguanine synthase